MAGFCLPTCLRPSARGARWRTHVLAGAARARFVQHVHLALAALVALGSLRAAPPEDWARAELVIDTPAAGAAVLRPWQSVCGRILRHRGDPPLYLAISLFGSPSVRMEAREVALAICLSAACAAGGVRACVHRSHPSRRAGGVRRKSSSSTAR
jgi:hypothetical protein